MLYHRGVSSGQEKTLPALDEMRLADSSLLSVRALAEYFGISVRRLLYAIRRGKLPAVLLGGAWHVRWGDFKRWQLTGMLTRRVPAIQCPNCGAVFRKTKTYVRIVLPAEDSA